MTTHPSRSWLVALLGALSPAAYAGTPAAPPPAGTIAISGPESLVLNKERRPAALELRLPAARDPQTQVRTSASAGKVSDLSDSGATQIGSFIPPDVYFPHLAIVGAVAKVGGRPAVGFKTILLLGSGNLTVKAAPKAPVSVRIGSSTFGPVTADRAGSANVPVTVAPGFSEALIVGTDRKLPLPSAPFKRLLALALDDTLPADGATSTELQAFVVDRTGKPDASAHVAFKAERGSTGAVTALAPGLYSTRYTPPSTTGNGADTVTYSLVDDPASKDTLVVRLTVGASIKLAFDPPQYRSGGKAPTVIVSVDGSDGRALDAALELTASDGKLGATRSLGTGRFSASLAPPDNFGGKQEIKVVALVTAQGGARTRVEASLPLKPGDPKRLEVAAQDLSLRADGANHLPIAVRALDEHGNAVPGVAIAAKVDEGEMAPPEASANGGYTFRYAPPVAFGERTVKVAFEGDGLQADVPVRLLPTERIFAVALMVGLDSNLSAMNAPTAALELDARLSFLTSRLFLALEIGGLRYANSSEAKTSLWAFPLSLLLRFELPSFGQNFLAYLAAGPTADFVTASAQSGSQSLHESLVVMGGQAQIGAGYRFGRTALALELKYLYANAKGEVVSGTKGEGQQVGGLGVGLRFSVDL